MDQEMIFTVIIPVLLIGILVYYNLHKFQSKAKEMKKNHENSGQSSCSSGCSGCAYSGSCSSKSTDTEDK
ncbi:hypothetical protein [Chakrabartyella piscis]|uniref:hypothetical protein n=1 Tax=Chakrabartyella piscis TaxID=2918914 RepID=UPI00295840BE|nr:hypothetical protein [Chakrabartyella piscis]